MAHFVFSVYVMLACLSMCEKRESKQAAGLVMACYYWQLLPAFISRPKGSQTFTIFAIEVIDKYYKNTYITYQGF